MVSGLTLPPITPAAITPSVSRFMRAQIGKLDLQGADRISG
jgi:hypothetical protein